MVLLKIRITIESEIVVIGEVFYIKRNLLVGLNLVLMSILDSNFDELVSQNPFYGN